MATSLTRKSSAPRSEEIPHLLAGRRAFLESLFYVATVIAVVALVASFGWTNLKSRNLSSEPLVVWKSEEPTLLREAMRGGLIGEFPGNPGEQGSPSEGIPCSQLGESWFRAMPDLPENSRRPSELPYPLACDWTPEPQDVIVINR